MDYLYFPGCTLNTKARNLDLTARECSRLLGFELREMADWTCCGATFPLSADSLMGLLPPARLLARAREQGPVLTTLCSICFNVLRRTNHLLQQDAVKRDTINAFIEKDYRGDLRVAHYLELLRDDLGFPALAGRVVRKLAGLRLAAYYGCMLLRPAGEMCFDDPENPRVMENFLEALGAEAVPFPLGIECCGSFQSIGAPELAAQCAHRILRSAAGNGADALVTSCPLCAFNLDHRQEEIARAHPDFKPVPVFYITQLLGLALGLDAGALDFGRNHVNPMPLLAARGLVETGPVSRG